MQDFPPSRSAARDRLSAFIPHAGEEYAKKRNYDLGPEDRTNVSLLSPYLRYRLITESEVVDAVLEKHSPGKAEKFLQEVFWRTYWKGWLELRPSVWTQYLNGLERQKRSLGDRPESYHEAVNGRTGIDCFDHWARELVETGYLHNHSRMWFASIWTFTLELPWELGADFFYHHLLDGDPASNTLGWRWVAGLQTRGKHYTARASNIRKYTKERFDPSGKLREDVAPISEDSPHPPPEPLSQVEGELREPFVLVLHEDDLSPDEVLLQNPSLQGVFIVPPFIDHPSVTKSEKAEGFLRSCLSDLRSRLAGQTNVAMEEGSLREFCEQQSARAIALYRPFVGPLRDSLERYLKRDENRVPHTIFMRKEWDEQWFPAAKKGFFQFRSQIPLLNS